MPGDAVDAYIDATAARLVADGCEVRTEQWNGTRVLIGYRSDSRLRWMAARLHLFTVISAARSVNAGSIETFTVSATRYVRERDGDLRGAPARTAVLACLVSPTVDAGADGWARQQRRTRSTCIARPVVVDVTTGKVSSFRGQASLDAAYSTYLRDKLDTYFPIDTAP